MVVSGCWWLAASWLSLMELPKRVIALLSVRAPVIFLAQPSLDYRPTNRRASSGRRTGEPTRRRHLVIPSSPVAQNNKIAVIAGDGIGKEVIPQAVKVLEAAGAPLAFAYFDWGADRYLKDGTTVPADGFQTLARDFAAILVGAIGDPRVPSNIHAKEILLGMRFKMDLYANLRPVRLLDPSLCPLKAIEPKDVDFVVIRENTEGMYVDSGGIFKPGTTDEVAIQEDINTRKGVERVIRFAFEFCLSDKKADGRARRRVLMCDKSNVMTYAGNLWQRVFKQVSADFPQIQSEHMYVDALCMQMVREPRSFDVIVTNNLFGDIITDLAAALQGGLGMAASGNIHPGKTSMFEPVHGSAPALAGKNIANPMGAILTAAMMLDRLGFVRESDLVECAVLEAVHQKKTTPDIGGVLGTREVGDWIARRVAG
jgi:3-isopropylmalate dehydrogenase